MKNFYGLMEQFCWLPLLLLLAGCPATIPEIKPFADRTAEMATAMNKGYTQTEVSLTEAEDEKHAKELQKRWASTKEALIALVAYSDSLAAIADAGNKGSDSAKAVATSLNGLLTAVSPLVGATQLSAGLIKGMEAINSYVAKVRAHDSMAKAVEAAQPAIDQLAEVMAKNFDDLEGIYKSSTEEQLRLLMVSNNKQKLARESNQEIANYHDGLIKQRRAITPTLTLILDYQNETNTTAKNENLNAAMERDAPLRETIKRMKQCREVSCKDEPSIVEDRQIQLLAKWRALQGELDRIAPEYNAYIATEAALKEQIASGKLIFKKSKESILAWRDTHAQIRVALDQKQRLTIQKLATVIKDINDVYKKGGK